MIALVNRETELRALRGLAEDPGPRLGLLFGRRRVGKTFLLVRAWPGQRVFYFLGADSTPAMNRMDLIRDLAEWSGRALEEEDFPSWRTVFRLFVDLAREDRLIVVLDEFQYLTGADDDAASQLVAVWDHELGDVSLTLVLCGSEVSTMEQLRDADQPLYGRFDWSHRLAPFDYFDAARMLPSREDREAAAAYGILGGTPQHLAAVRKDAPLSAAVCEAMLDPGGPVRIQVENIIEQQKGIRKPAEYGAVMTAIARGRTHRNEIATGAGLEGRPETVRHILDRLQELELVRPESNFEAARNAPIRYRVSENAVGFWYRFVDANRSFLKLGRPRDVWEAKIGPNLDTYLGTVFEGVCREGFIRKRDEWGVPSVSEWSRWEGRDRTRRPIEIDVVARLAGGGMLTGEVEWSSSPVGPSLHTGLLRDLEGLAASGQGWAHAALPENDGARYVYFSAAGFTAAFREMAAADERIWLVDLDDLYAGRDVG